MVTKKEKKKEGYQNIEQEAGCLDNTLWMKRFRNYY
jgi:hypothetical protein